MRVLSLEIHGFKSFPHATRLEFDSGVAAVVGPNGSGKSNVVEAVRWVLGEQSLSQLRGKRTEDVIWAGTKGRAPSGMAEVSITFDNSDRSLPTDYSEVTITRRAYRSGENEYMINRSRVRLRDVAELVAALGQGYTVVGQGTADAALSLSPEGRRGMFEEAADITQHYARRDESLRRLAEMESNSVRVLDLLAELKPRLRALARQARQARERDAEEARLRELHLAYYSRELRIARTKLEDARVVLRGATSEVARLRAEEETLASKEAHLRQEVEAARAHVDRNERERSALLREEQEATRAAIGAEARASGLERQRADAQRAVAATTRLAAEASAELGKAEQVLQHALAQADQLGDDLRAQEQQEAANRRTRTEQGVELEALRRASLQAEEQTARARNREIALKDRLSSLQAEQERRTSESGEEDARLRQARESLASARSGHDSATQEEQAASAALDAARQQRATVAAELDKLVQQARLLREQLADVEARRRRLEDAREHGAGLSRASLAVLTASAEDRLSGIVGVLASLIEVPEHLEQAIEAALGGALQNVVARDWRSAEDAIGFLKRTGAGRATFLPLDSLRPSPSLEPPHGSGIVGIASNLVTSDPSVRPAVQHALGRVLIVQQLADARALVDRMRGLSAVVTLTGETIRPGGAVTGGAAVREHGALARERELRELPAQIQQADAALRQAEIETQAARQRLQERDAEARTLASQHSVAERAARDAGALVERAGRTLGRLEQEREWSRATLQRGQAEQDALTRSLHVAEAERRAAEDEASKTSARVRSVSEQARRRDEAEHASLQQVSELRTQVAVTQERLRAARDREQATRTANMRAESELKHAQERLSRLSGEHDQTGRQVAEARARQHMLQEQVRSVEARLSTPLAAVARLTPEIERTRAQGSSLLRSVLVAEEARLAATAAVGRAEIHLHNVEERARQDLGQGEIPPSLDSPPDVEARIASSRQRLARIGPVNSLAAQEHQELTERAAFLEKQVSDIRAAQDDLRLLIASIEDQMERRFDHTFKGVSERFGENFERLFGGGSARLALASKGESVGVEIQAQPPGKRLGSLALLSGGERALTSCALLFALIQTGGAPFCVLDEVDAALDESNVGRFCDLLEELSRETQFIVVTHNRGTIERASRLYGVSMEPNGASKVLSLRLDTPEERRATA